MQPLLAQERIARSRDADSPVVYVDSKAARVRRFVLISTRNLEEAGVGGIRRTLQRPLAQQLAADRAFGICILVNFQRYCAASVPQETECERTPNRESEHCRLDGVAVHH